MKTSMSPKQSLNSSLYTRNKDYRCVAICILCCIFLNQLRTLCRKHRCPERTEPRDTNFLETHFHKAFSFNLFAALT